MPATWCWSRSWIGSASTRELLDLIERIGSAGAAFRSLGESALGYVVIARVASLHASGRHR
jgi:hypothetical protein